MRLLFITVWDFTNSNGDGICKKIQAQYEEFKRQGFDVDFTYIKNGSTFLNDSKNNLNFLGKNGILGKVMAHYYIYKKVKRGYYEAIYIRYGMGDTFFFLLLKKLKSEYTKVILEIPTYPYDPECENKTLDKINLFLDKLYRKRLYPYVNRVAAITEENFIFHIPVVHMSNGIDYKLIPLRNVDKSRDGIHLIAVACMEYWHGYDRLLKGLGEYYKKDWDIHCYLHLVGEGRELGNYKKIVQEYHLEAKVFFYGKKYGEELNDIYDKCDIGVECLGIHRKKLQLSSSLKSREYMGRGMPMITSAKLDIFPHISDYILKLPEGEEKIQIDSIIEFYNRIYQGKDKNKVAQRIRDISEKYCGISAAVKGTCEFFKGQQY